MKNKVISKLGEMIEERGLKMKWVSEQIDSTQAQLTNWCKNDESGTAKSTPSVLYILRLQKLLNVRVEEMFQENELEE